MICGIIKLKIVRHTEEIFGNGILSPNFQAAVACFAKMLAGLIVHSKRHICPSENNRH